MDQKKRRPTSEGTCNLCGGTFSKSVMTRHLKSCIQKAVPSEKPSGSLSRRKSMLLHLVVEGRYRPEYWMHIEVPARAKLEDLDNFLRDIWVECCSHMSAFTIHGESYTSAGPFGPLMGRQSEMGVELGQMVSPGMKFIYEYDFGTTTELVLRVVSEREGVMGDDRVRLLARNDPPPIPCGVCGKLATQVCLECAWSGEGWLCDDCADDHECDEERFLPVVNSPRVGMCGYTGSTATHQ